MVEKQKYSLIEETLNNIDHKKYKDLHSIDETKIKPILVKEDNYILCVCPYLKNYCFTIDLESCEEFNGKYFCKNCPYLKYLKSNNLNKKTPEVIEKLNNKKTLDSIINDDLKSIKL